MTNERRQMSNFTAPLNIAIHSRLSFEFNCEASVLTNRQVTEDLLGLLGERRLRLWGWTFSYFTVLQRKGGGGAFSPSISFFLSFAATRWAFWSLLWRINREGGGGPTHTTSSVWLIFGACWYYRPKYIVVNRSFKMNGIHLNHSRIRSHSRSFTS